MRRRLAAVLAVVCAGSMLMAGCAGSKNIETEELTITGYKGIEVDEIEKPGEITDEDVENEIQTILEANAKENEITDREVKDGDSVNINFTGKINGEAFEGGSGENYPLTIGQAGFIEGFEDSIIGHNVEDTYDWNGKFPDDYGSADLAGKDVVFTITVNSITEKEVPELNKDFVKSVSKKSKTVKEYKQEVKKQLEESGEATYNENLSASVWQAVLDKTEVKKYPKKEVKKLSETLIQQYKDAAKYYEMEYEKFIEDQMGSTVEDFEKQVDKAAKSSAKQSMVTEAIADKEKIKMSDEEYEEQLKKLADAYGYEDVDAVKEAAEEEDLKEMALNNLVKEWLVDHCVQVKAKSDSKGDSKSDE